MFYKGEKLSGEMEHGQGRPHKERDFHFSVTLNHRIGTKLLYRPYIYSSPKMLRFNLLSETSSLKIM